MTPRGPPSRRTQSNWVADSVTANNTSPQPPPTYTPFPPPQTPATSSAHYQTHVSYAQNNVGQLPHTQIVPQILPQPTTSITYTNHPGNVSHGAVYTPQTSNHGVSPHPTVYLQAAATSPPLHGQWAAHPYPTPQNSGIPPAPPYH